MSTTGPLAYRTDEHRVHLIVYHLIWCPKRRKPVLAGAVAEACRRLLELVCAERGWDVLALAIRPDHVHLSVRVGPTTPADAVVRACKGRTAHDLRRDFPRLLRLPSLWTRRYFASTAGTVSSATVRRYVEAQRGV
jgi:putative transposase